MRNDKKVTLYIAAYYMIAVPALLWYYNLPSATSNQQTSQMYHIHAQKCLKPDNDDPAIDQTISSESNIDIELFDIDPSEKFTEEDLWSIPDARAYSQHKKRMEQILREKYPSIWEQQQDPQRAYETAACRYLEEAVKEMRQKKAIRDEQR